MQQIYSCPSCGSPLEYGAQFCGNCGTPMNWPTQQQMQPLPPQPPPSPPPAYQQPPPPPYGYGQQPPPPGYQQQWNYQQMPPHQQQQYAYGWQHPKKQGSSTWIILFAVFACVFLLAGAYLIWSGGEFGLPGSSGASDDSPAAAQDGTSSDGEQEDGEEQGGTTITDTSIEDLVADYQTDAEAAKAKYNGKRITITGKVGGYSTSEFWVLISNGEPDAVGAKCMFSESDMSKISALEPGETIKVTGKIGEYETDITVTDCVFSS